MTQEFKEQLLTELVSRFETIVESMIAPVRVRTSIEIKRLIEDSPEYDSMTFGSGQLRGELGMIDAKDMIDTVIAAIIDAMDVKKIPFVRTGDGFTGGIYVGILRSDFSDALSAKKATFQTPEHEHTIDWLEWLLSGGTDEIVHGYWYLNTAATVDSSRTKLGIMVPTGKTHAGWSVPKEFSGTLKNNWLTRALSPLIIGAPSIMQEILESELLQRV